MKKYQVTYYESLLSKKIYFDNSNDVNDFVEGMNNNDYIVCELNSLGYYQLNSSFWK